MFRGSWILAAAGVLVLSTAGYGQGAAIGAADSPDVKDDVRVAQPSEYWIGVVLSATAQREGDEPAGLKVVDVMPGGPAAKAGIRAGDRVLSAGEKPVKDVRGLVAQIDGAKGKPVAIEVLRDGETQELEVTPEKRPVARQPFRELLPPGHDWDAWRKWMEEMEEGQPDQAGPFRFRFFGPGAILPPAEAQKPQPEDMSITVTKKGEAPAKIVVKQGEQTWRTTEDELGKLPDEVRPHVERLLGRGLGGLTRGRAKLLEGPRIRVHPEPLKVLPHDEIRKRLDQRFEQMDQRIEELRKSIDELRGKEPEGAETEKKPETV